MLNINSDNAVRPNNFPITVTKSMTYYQAIRSGSNPNILHPEYQPPLDQLHVVDTQSPVASANFTQPQRNEKPLTSILRSVQNSHVSQYKSKSRIHGINELHENTLDESIWDSVSKQFISMFQKLKHVIVPKFDGEERERVKNWDLWGPLVICLGIGLILDDPNQLFILTFITFVGGMLVTFNSKVLGGKVSVLQSISILGYCVFPLFVAGLFIWIMKLLNFRLRIVSILFVVLGVIWSIMSARVFIICNVPEGRYFLAMYPVFLFYIFIGVFVLYI